MSPILKINRAGKASQGMGLSVFPGWQREFSYALKLYVVSLYTDGNKGSIMPGERWTNTLDAGLNIISAGSGAAVWQMVYDLMADNLQEEYFNDLPPIDKPGEYFGNGYYWATNILLGIAGGVGSMLPYALASLFDTRQHSKQLAYLLCNSFVPDALWQTFYDVAWYLTLEALQDEDVQYPTDSVQHALMCLLIFMPVALLAHYAYNTVLDSKNPKYGVGNSIVYSTGAAGFLIGTRKITEAQGYKALPISFLSASTGAAVGEMIRQLIRHYSKPVTVSSETEEHLLQPHQQRSRLNMLWAYCPAWLGGPKQADNEITGNNDKSGWCCDPRV
jgi:hypothetical protein